MVQKAARTVGIVFLIVGVAGFVPGLTSDYDRMDGMGHESMALLLGIFMVSWLHNLVHLLFGVAGLVSSRRWSSSRAYLIGGGAIYLLLWVYGLVVDHDSAANFVPLNSADNWLHLVLGLGMIAIGVLLSRTAHRAADSGHDTAVSKSGADSSV
ncbi:DUF4383 domain-containing protein [Terrabacter aeriphilus]|uniref:DUF4383 domain-containing protein n=2 Tax=Terrabacter aeriphilus TaxID=515662 RepID=A0ABP9JL35_9MICO